jgi:hypothetical protein
VHHIVLSAMQTNPLTGSTQMFFVQFFDGTTAQCAVVFRSDGAILLQAGTVGGTTLATYTGAISALNTWFAFEIEVVINNTTGSITVRKNGNTANDFTLGSLNTRGSANNYANKIGIGFISSPGGGNQYFDDILWRSDASSVAWVGDVRVYTRLPASDVTAQLTRSSSSFQQQSVGPTSSLASLTASQPRYNYFVSQGGTISSVVMNAAAALTGNVKCAIFAASTANPPVPTTVIQSATAVVANPVIGANTFTFSPAVTLAAGTPFFVAICTDTTGSFLNAGTSGPWNGLACINNLAYASFPQANPVSLSMAQAQFNFGPVVTATANASCVNDAMQDGPISYNYSSTPGQGDLYNLQATLTTPNSVLATVTRGYLAKSDAGSRTAGVQLQSGSANVQGLSASLGTGAFQWVWRTDLVDPNTGSAWTAAAVTAAQIGPIVTA